MEEKMKEILKNKKMLIICGIIAAIIIITIVVVIIAGNNGAFGSIESLKGKFDLIEMEEDGMVTTKDDIDVLKKFNIETTIEFNDDNEPVCVHRLYHDSEKNHLNGWIDLQNYFREDKHTYSFLGDNYYNSDVDIVVAIRQWAKQWANYEVRNRIVDSIEDEEDV